MEMAAAAIIRTWSFINCGIVYVTVLSDGNAKIYQIIVELNVYGGRDKITKEKCVTHAAKRFRT